MVYYQNMGGIKGKLNNIFESLNCSIYDILIFTETWLDDGINDAEVCPSSFSVYRMDRNVKNSKKTRGGGVAILVRSSFCSGIVKHSCESVEQLFVHVTFGSDDFIFGAVYVPPNSDETVYTAHGQSVEEVSLRHPNSRIFICGDYNVPGARWSSERFILSDDTSLFDFCGSMDYVGLSQVCRIVNRRNVLLDLVYTNDHLIEIMLASDSLKSQDMHHCPLQFQVTCSPDTVRSSCVETPLFDFYKGDYIGLNQYFSMCDWSLDAGDVDGSVSRFYELLYCGMQRFIPVKIRTATSFPSWFNKQLIRLIFCKKRAHKRYLRSRTNLDYGKFCELRKKCKILSDTLYIRHIQEIENNLNYDPQNFWKFIRSRKGNQGIPGRMNFKGVTSSDGVTVANLFADFFSEVYSGDIVVPNNCQYERTVDIDICQFTTVEIFELISSIKPKLGSGPDGVPNYLLKNCVSTLAAPLCGLFNMSLKLGIFPSVWKRSYVIPTFKKGDRTNVENYRGICLVSSIPKLLDSLVSKHLSWHTNKIIMNEQHGFCRGKSTTTNLILLIRDILDAFHSGAQLDAVYTDFSKAFDVVNHNLLLSKLEAVGVHGPLLSWFASFLRGRSQMVCYHNFSSRIIEVSSGVTQGSHLGPELFKIFINDITDCLITKILLFADDSKFFMKIRDVNDALFLQRQINMFSDWAQSNFLPLNIQKCQIISFSRSRAPIEFRYEVDGVVLSRVRCVNDLGVLLDSRLNFKDHFQHITSRALRTMGVMLRSTTSFSLHTVVRLFCALVRPLLEYSSCVWSPHYACDISTIERVQKKFLGCLAYRLRVLNNSANHVLLRNQFNLEHLVLRRRAADLYFLYNLLNGTLDCPELLSLINFNVPGRITRNTPLFRCSLSNNNYNANFFMNRVLHLVSTLGNDIDFFEGSLNRFKSKVKNLLRTSIQY